MRNQFIVAAALLALVGCVPEFEGTAEFTIKSSEVHKALAGKPARIRLREKLAHPITNAYERVTFGGGHYTNQLDVVKSLVESRNGLLPTLHEFYTKDEAVIGDLTNDTVRLSIDETPGQAPVLRMESDIAVWLSQTNVLEKALDERHVHELMMLSIDSENGALKDVDPEKFRHINPRHFSFVLIGTHQFILLTGLFGEESMSSLTMASAYAVLPALPEFVADRFYTIVGDSDEPLTVEAEDVTSDGKHHDTFKATVKRGETLRLKINKKHAHGGIRFRKGSL